MQTWMWVLVVVVVAGGAFLAARASRTEEPPRPKRFGRNEAHAAREFLSTPEQAGAVLAVVVGVLGYANVVAEEVQAFVTNMRSRVAERLEMKSKHEERIEAFRREIDRLLQRNAGDERDVADAEALAGLFRG